MALYETIRLAKHPNGITELILSRPEKLNSANQKFFEELVQAQQELTEDEGTKVGELFFPAQFRGSHYLG